MMKLVYIILLLVFHVKTFAQKDFFKDRKADLELGINLKYNLTTVELGLNLFKDYPGQSCGGLLTNDIIIGSEFGLKNNDFIYVPKFTYSYNLILINGSISLLNYNYSENHSIYLRPQIGATFLGYIDLVYGYNIPIRDRNLEFQGNIITLRIKLFRTIKDHSK